MIEGKEFEYLDHTADLMIRAYGKTLEELLENCSKAFFNAISPGYLEKISIKRCIKIRAEGEDLEDLLFHWMSELVYMFDTERLLGKKFSIKIERKEGKYEAIGEICGEEFDPEKHDYALEVKAMTYNMLKVSEKNGKYVAEFVMDV